MAQLYALRGLETGKIKIGVTENFDMRLPSYKTHCAEPLETIMLFEVGGARAVAEDLETIILDRHRNLVTHGEWLLPSDELLRTINDVSHIFRGYGAGIFWTAADRAQREAIHFDVRYQDGSEQTELTVNRAPIACFSKAHIADLVRIALRDALRVEYRLNSDGSGCQSELPGPPPVVADESGAWAI